MTLFHDEPARLELHAQPDEVLVELAREGHHAAFDVLIRRHQEKATGLAMGMMRNEADARDCVQDAFLNAWRKLDSFRGDARFSSWLYRITHNACLMKMRSRRRRPEVPLEVRGTEEDGFERQLADPHRGADTTVEIEELGRQLDRAVETLPDSYREVFELADLEHRSMKDIANALGLTVPNVKTRLHRARLRLRSELEPYLAAEPVVRC